MIHDKSDAKHHYVTQAYLRRWTKDSKCRDFFYVDLENAYVKEWRPSNPAKICYKPGLYGSLENSYFESLDDRSEAIFVKVLGDIGSGLRGPLTRNLHKIVTRNPDKTCVGRTLVRRMDTRRMNVRRNGCCRAANIGVNTGAPRCALRSLYGLSPCAH